MEQIGTQAVPIERHLMGDNSAIVPSARLALSQTADMPTSIHLQNGSENDPRMEDGAGKRAQVFHPGVMRQSRQPAKPVSLHTLATIPRHRGRLSISYRRPHELDCRVLDAVFPRQVDKI